MQGESDIHFSSALPVIVLSRPEGATGTDWQEIDRGPGYFNVPAGQVIGVKIKSINDVVLYDLVQELRPVSALRYLDLAENRNITNESMAALSNLTQLQGLNLSACSVTSTGLESLKKLIHLKWLMLTYCNRLTDNALKTLESMMSLEYVDIKGCVGITKGGLARIRRRNLQIVR